MRPKQKPSQHSVAQRASHLALGVGAAALLAAAPQAVRADTMPTSVDVHAVSVSPNAPSTDSPEVGIVRVAFDNTNRVAANEVVIQVISQSGVVRQQIDDKGTFAPGTVVVHTFMVPGAQDVDMVQIAAVKYVDGSTWTAAGSHLEGDSEESVLNTGSALNAFGGR